MFLDKIFVYNGNNYEIIFNNFTKRYKKFTELDGKIPINPSGGLLARGHPIGSSGLAQMYELVTQLRGEVGKRQVKDPKIALAHNGGGTIGSGEVALCVHIFEKL